LIRRASAQLGHVLLELWILTPQIKRLRRHIELESDVLQVFTLQYELGRKRLSVVHELSIC
jgi:hypothetical protein